MVAGGTWYDSVVGNAHTKLYDMIHTRIHTVGYLKGNIRGLNKVKTHPIIWHNIVLSTYHTSTY
jgi:hypothetical protein